MTNEGLLKIIGLAVDNKDLIGSLINELDLQLLKKGVLAIPEHAVNSTLRPYITSAVPMISDYHVMFEGGTILADASVSIPKVGGVVELSYSFTITEFKFDSAARMMTAGYKESVKTQNALAKMALSALGLGGGSLLQKALSKAAKSGLVYATEDVISVNLTGLEALKKVPEELTVNYLGIENGTIKLGFLLE